MIVCVCRRVSDREIERHAHSGVTSFDELQMETGVATCCGRCGDCAREVFDNAQTCAGTIMSHVNGRGRPTTQTIPILLAA